MASQGTNQYECPYVCGFEGQSQRDVEEHLIQMGRIDDPIHTLDQPILKRGKK